MAKKKKATFFLALAVLWAALGFAVPAGAAEWVLYVPPPEATYGVQFSYATDPGRVAQNSWEMWSATQSWQTSEYLRSWGLTAENASTAYALGYFGQGVSVGIIDSGFWTTHIEFQGEHFVPVVIEGVYGTSGFRYRHQQPQNPFVAGDPFYMTGAYNSGDADPWKASHGTGMMGILAANRDGPDDRTGTLLTNNMHGFAWASTVYMSNTGASDSNTHGPYHDYTFMYASYKALVDAGAQVIN